MPVQSAIEKIIPTGLKIPKPTINGNGHPTPSGKATPKTPQDEALAFFSAGEHTGDPVQVWELWLEDDGGPGEQKSVS